MFSRLLRHTASLAQPAQRFSFASSRQGGNLYTWGQRSAGLGVSISSESLALSSPQLVEDFNNNVAKVAMGPTHTAVITTEGDLYTFGYCQYGVLGHGESDVSHYTPKLVNFFAENRLKVKDVVAGEYHTAALTEDGDVYTWGFGGKSANPLVNICAPSYGALGLGANADRYVPTLIEDIRNVGNKQSLTSGYGFCAFLTGDNEIYNWGEGFRGVFAEESHKHLKTPTLNEAAQHVSEHEGAKIIKIRACANSVLALLDNGALYGWGNNELGQLGIKKDVGIELYENIFEPTKFNGRKLKGKKIVDFDLGQELGAVLTDSNEVYWFGHKLALEPELIAFPEGARIKKVAVTNPSVTIITENNEVYTSDQLISSAELNPHTGIYRVRESAFNGGQVVDIGGQYVNKYAIVRS